MKRTRAIGLYAAVSSLLLCITGFWWFNHAFFADIPRAHRSGERLGFATFRLNEFIQVKSAHGDRGVRLREYRFYWAGGSRYVDVDGNTDSMDNRIAPLVRGREFQPKEAEGIDALVAWFRRRDEERISGVSRYEIDYFRDNQPIGDEVFIGYHMPGELAFLRRDSGMPNAQLRADFHRMALEASLTDAELDRIFPFEQLEADGVRRTTEGR